MLDAFKSGIADFSGIDGKGELFIEKVLHKGYLDVNERGVEAAAVSVTVVSAGIVRGIVVILFFRHSLLSVSYRKKQYSAECFYCKVTLLIQRRLSRHCGVHEHPIRLI